MEGGGVIYVASYPLILMATQIHTPPAVRSETEKHEMTNCVLLIAVLEGLELR